MSGSAAGGRPRRAVILGAGVAGLAAALRLAESGRYAVLVLERAPDAGGLASTVSLGAAPLDLGSHRIHPDYLPEVLDLLRQLLGPELLRVPRRGKLCLNGAFLPYPPSLLAMLAALGPRTALACGWGFLRARAGRALRRPRRGEPTYEDHLCAAFGRPIYELFFQPYARKVYATDPAALSAACARERFAYPSVRTLVRQLLRRWTGRPAAAGPFFYYPARGFGSIPRALLQEALVRGAVLKTDVTLRELRAGSEALEVTFDHQGTRSTARAAAVVSTIPLSHLIALVRPEAPPDVVASARALRWRGIRLLQAVVRRQRCLEGETYYFPEERYLFGRISEPAQYSPLLGAGPDRTTLNIEVICAPGDDVWMLDETAFFTRVVEQVESLRLLRRDEVAAYRSIRLPAVYPVYETASHAHLQRVLTWIESLGALYSIGRGGMFLHGNVDHSIDLGLRAAEHLLRSGGRAAGWRAGLPARAVRARS